LEFALDGSRLKGRWHLVRMRRKPGEKSEPWLLIKADDEFARQPGEGEITDEAITSALSGRTTEELAAEGDVRADHQARAKVMRSRKLLLPDISKIAGAKKGLLPTFLAPSLASPCDKPPSGPKWVHEIKYDGYRIQARIDGRSVKLLTRKNLDWTERFSSIATALRELRLGSALLDGEIVVEDAAARRASTLCARSQSPRYDIFRYHVIDLLYCEGFDLTRATLLDRKGLLAQCLAGVPADFPVRFSEHLDEDGPTMFEHAGRLGLEGIISKRKTSLIGPTASTGSRANASPSGVCDPWLRAVERGKRIGRLLAARLLRRQYARLCRAGRNRLVNGAGQVIARGARKNRGSKADVQETLAGRRR
jgi:bifunctional non-homologous end joining protein LigD